MKIKALIILIFCLTSTASYLSWAQPISSAGQKVKYTPANKECFSVSRPRAWKYCVHTPKEGSSNGDIAYLLHGRGQTEDNWNDDTFYTAQIQQYWQQRKISPPTVVSISFGPVWLLNTKGKQPASGLADIFTNEVIPTVELRLGKPVRRLLFGESMGGINTLVLGLKHPELFKKIAALCPPVYLGTPFDSEKDLQDFIDRTGADPAEIKNVLMLAKMFYADKDEWLAHAPHQMIQNMVPENAPALYLSCGLYDKFGNYEGTEALSVRALQNKFQLDWVPLYGPHCAVDIKSVAEFLTN
ncbi:MAG: alpha/beta hydrolase [Bdellovibrionales bacterium]